MTAKQWSVVVVGAGLMGSQISLLCAARGHTFVVVDADSDAVDRCRSQHTDQVDDYVRGGASAEQDALGRIRYSTTLGKDEVASADIVIEAIAEHLDLKRRLFEQLDALTSASTILATNISSLRASQIAVATRHRQRVINLHFYQPVWDNPIVEIMGGPATDPTHLDRAQAFAVSLGVLPIRVQRESTGFVANRIWRAIKREALHLVADGVATPEDVDRSWMVLYGNDIGPFGRMDRVGLDVVLAIERTYHDESGLDFDAPPAMLVDMVARDELGVKTKKGFYAYPHPAFEDTGFLLPPTT